MHIFFGFSEVANYYSHLVKGLDQLNVNYTFLSWGKSIRNYSIDENPSIEQNLLHYFARNTKQNFLLRYFQKSIFYCVRVFLFFKYLYISDVFVFSYNASFLGGWDLPIMKLCNKKIIYIYYGSDSRPPFISGNFIGHNKSTKSIKISTKNIYKKIKWREKFADEIVCLPGSAQFFDRDLINFSWLGMPFSITSQNPPTKPHRIPRVIHAPTEKKGKGTAEIIRIINELTDDGLSFEFKLLHNVTNDLVLETLTDTDILIDEMYSDTMLGGLGTEAASKGVCTIVGGYHGAELNAGDQSLTPPCFYVSPDKIKETLKFLIENKQKRDEVGRVAYKYVKRKLSPDVVAKKLLQIIDGTVPSEARFDPCLIRNINGWGCSEHELKSELKQYVDDHDYKSLYLSHNRELLNEYRLALAN